MATILVTGVSGHIGRHVAARLSRHHTVYGMSRTAPAEYRNWQFPSPTGTPGGEGQGEGGTMPHAKPPHPNPLPLSTGGEGTETANKGYIPPAESSAPVHHLAVDLFDFHKVRDVVANLRPEWLVHLAWHAYVPDYLASSAHSDWATASGHLFDVFSEQGGRRAVFAGSIYEVTLADTAYSVAKAQLRDEILKTATRLGISLAWCRFYGTYGPGDPPHKFIPSLIESLLKGQGALPHNPNLCRDYLHVADVADAMAAVLESDLEGIIDIASGRSVALKDLYAALRELVAAGDLPAIPTTPTQPPITGELQRTGWRQTIPLEAGLGQTVEWHRQNAATN